PLGRSGPESDSVDRVMLSAPLHPFTAPQGIENGKALIEHLRPQHGIALVPEQLEIAPSGRPDADPEDQPTVADQVQRGGLPSQHGGAPARRAREARAL